MAAVLALLAFPQNRASAEYAIEPGIAIGEEYNDNVNLQPDNREHDYITRVLPSIRLVYAAPAWEWDLSYTLDLRYYARRTRTDDNTHQILFGNRTNIIRDTLFLELRDSYRRVSLDTTRDYTKLSLFSNQTDENEFTAHPYLRFDLTTHTSGTAGYQYRNVWYERSDAINTQENTVYTDLRDDLSPRTSILANVRYTREEASILNFQKFDVGAGPRYEYAENSFVWLILGNSWFDAPEVTGTAGATAGQWGSGTQAFWDLGFTYTALGYTLTAGAVLSYIDDPYRIKRREDRYSASFRKETERTLLQATVGLWEYRNVLTKRLQNTKYAFGGTVSYRFTPALRAAYTGNIERNEDNEKDAFSMLYLNIAGVEYAFPANTVLTLEYRFAHNYAPLSGTLSPQEKMYYYNQNYDNNRLILEVRKTF